MTDLTHIDDADIYQEMLTHPAFFSHNCPQKIAIIGDVNCRLLEEALKHQAATEIWTVTQYLALHPPEDPKIYYYDTMPTFQPHYFDIIINVEETEEALFPAYFEALASSGILLQISGSPFNVSILRENQINLQLAGFRDVQIVSFPQPSFTTGWRAALMAKKNGIFTRVKEKAIFNKPFSTRYYNLDVHKGSLVLPEFLREALTI